MELFWILVAAVAFNVFFRFGRALARVSSVQVRRATPPSRKANRADRTHIGLLLSDLPIGVASFDAEMRLDTFNPTFAEMFTLPVEWLAARPKFDTVLEDLRQRSALPTPKNFTAWVEGLKSLKNLDRGQIWHDIWRLPDGRNIEVHARSYPKDRIGLQFTDLTESYRREQDLMVELATLHQAMDAVDHGVIVFDTGGGLAFSNAALDRIWGTNMANSFGVNNFNDMLSEWKSRAHPNPFWGDLTDFATSTQDRSEWTGEVTKLSGERIYVRVSPLSQSALMCEFWHAD